MKLHDLGIDLGKTVFHLVGLDSTGKVVISKRSSRQQLLAFRESTLSKGRCYMEEALPQILEDAQLLLSGSFRLRLAQLKLDLEQLSARIDQLDAVVLKKAKEDDACQRLIDAIVGSQTPKCGHRCVGR